MGLKQIQHTDRIIFLRKFTKEILLTAYRSQQVQKNINDEKLRQRFIAPSLSPDDAFKRVIRTPTRTSMFKPSRYSIKPILPQKSTRAYQPSISGQRGSTPHRAEMQRIQPVMKPAIQKQIKQPQETEQKPVLPVPSKRPKELSLGKLDTLLNDTSVQTIECPGPVKNILIKRHNKINSTRLLLSQKEISEAIENFSKQAKIPIIGGLFKAAVGDLIISAVISEFVGSRFIINKMSPYSLIEN